ncbi:unnamed protein product [Bathycoccus prasinos]
MAAHKGNLEMLKYCFANDCPCDEEEACRLAAEEDTSTVETFARYRRRSGSTGSRNVVTGTS